MLNSFCFIIIISNSTSSSSNSINHLLLAVLAEIYSDMFRPVWFITLKKFCLKILYVGSQNKEDKAMKFGKWIILLHLHFTFSLKQTSVFIEHPASAQSNEVFQLQYRTQG